MSTDKARGKGPAEPVKDSANGPAEPGEDRSNGSAGPGKDRGNGSVEPGQGRRNGPAGQGENGQEAGAAASSGPERTPDGHHIVVKGRKWRATDTGIPETFRKELVAELMSARRAVKSRDEHARDRVQDAKVALGERGEPWWEEPTEDGLRAREAATIRALLRHRAGKTICPSDVARTLGGDDWRDLMPQIRDVAGEMAGVGEITVTQKGETVDPCTARGPIRLAPGPDLAGMPADGE
ncbi:DUF3253 domain-containing protein [Kocuria rhizophila]|uniref:DUF3253 domain-containing protein n=1 Tax=Kocuria rhizophila TaxID=72000 RepID=UPI0025AF71C9|nr:DUF3253 domain-containing protein [Kocuria rhizophila]MDN3226616.1 DUF3253 domain-containing protein [Kocuria rhizophila]